MKYNFMTKQVDDRSIQNMPLNDLRSLIMGKEGPLCFVDQLDVCLANDVELSPRALHRHIVPRIL